ncbi:MAG: DUF2141 domain-containing protein [Cytophagales bacterium]|nr:DUF2141 domain-containing protein [Bernardetiaceae bacterium]MDW8205283.1 DUF2141 domain-containing protein [Cytophagales bacterium]
MYQKILFVWVLLAFGSMLPTSLAAQSGKIIIEVNELRNTSGKVLAALYKDEKAFMKDEKQAVATAQGIISGDRTARITFQVPYGEYAFALLHDENNNGKMDTNLLGIPKEGYAASNNAKNAMGAPRYVDAKFTLDKAEIRQQIQMIYW